MKIANFDYLQQTLPHPSILVLQAWDSPGRVKKIKKNLCYKPLKKHELSKLHKRDQ